MKLSDNQLTKRRQLRLAELFIAGTVLLLVLSSGQQKHWPFVYWDLYSAGNYQIPQSANRVELRILDTGGQWHSLRSMDLYTLDDDTSNQRPGQNLIQSSFDEDNSAKKRRRFRTSLVKQIEAILGVEVETVEAWQFTWNVNFDEYPPLRIDQPVNMKRVGRFQAQEYAVSSKK
ncbi:MAG: hypothetical protein ACFB4I_12685 [Cyanophyceae cyanobacterium]